VGAISINLSGKEHLRFIPGIEVAAASIFPGDDLPEDARFQVTDSAELNLAVEAARLWVAVKEDKQPIGFAMANIIDGEAYLQEVGVLPEFGRRGIGRRLVNSVITWARVEGFKSVLLVTFKHLPWNAPFYAKLGFRKVQRASHGPEISQLFHEEKARGIDIDNRVAMRLIV